MREENTEQREREELSRGIILMLLSASQELQQENDELRSVNEMSCGRTTGCETRTRISGMRMRDFSA